MQWMIYGANGYTGELIPLCQASCRFYHPVEANPNGYQIHPCFQAASRRKNA